MSAEPAQVIDGNQEVERSDIIGVSDKISQYLKQSSSEAVVSLFDSIPEISALDYAAQEDVLRTKISALSQDERTAFAKARLVENLVNTAMPIIDHMDDQQDPDQNGYHLSSMIGLAKEAGYNARDMEKFLNTVRIWKSITPHPTEHLNKEGRDLYRIMMQAADLPQKERAAHILEVAQALLEKDITPTGKASMLEETHDALEQSSVHRQGIRKLYHEIKDAIDHVYADDGPNKPDLLGPGIRMDMALRIWHAGDADGKPNADRWSMMSTMVMLAKEAVDDHLSDLRKAINCELGRDENEAIEARDLYDLVENLSMSRAVQGRFKQNIASLATTLNTLDKIEAQCLLPDAEKPDYEDLKAQFAQLPIGGDFSREMCRDLNDLQTQFKNDRSREIIQESVFLMRMHGFASAKIETRHNGLIYDEIMDNLFTDREFLTAAKIELKDAHKIAAVGGFSKLDMAEQRKLMTRAQSHLSPKELQKALFSANQDNRAADDLYPLQTHEFLQRFRLMADHPHMFGMALIAEATDMSSEYQQFFADAFGVRNIINTPLPEEKETLESVTDSIIEYDKNGGSRNISQRMAGSWFRKDRENFHGLIIPCSDSTKQLGVFAKYQLREAITKVADWAFDNIKAVLTKEGNGGAIGRGGGTGKTFFRYIMQALKRNTDERNQPLNRNSQSDAVILEHASFMSNTEQGRFFRMLSSTPSQVAGHLSDNIGEMLGCRMELEGLVKDGTFIAPYDNFSFNMEASLEQAHHQMLQYRGIRHVKNDDGSYMIDNYAEAVSNMDIAGAANSGARPDSKSKKAKEFRKQRAIGSNIICDHTRMMQDCSLMNGAFLENIYQRYYYGELNDDDIGELLDSPFWRDHLQTVTMALSQNDPVHGAKRLGMSDWDHHKMMAVAESVQINVSKVEGETVAEMLFDDQGGTISKEQAYHAFVYADQFKSALLTEALLTLDAENMPEFAELMAAEAPEAGAPLAKVELGQETREVWAMAQIMRDAANEQHPERILSDIVQEEINAGAQYSSAYLRMVSSAQRATTVKHAPIYLDESHAFGHVRKAEWSPMVTLKDVSNVINAGADIFPDQA